MQHTVNILDRLGRKFFFRLQLVIHLLDHSGCHLGERDISNVGDDVQPYMVLVAFACRGLYIADVLRHPCVQPVSGFEPRNVHIRPVIDLRRDGGELLADFFLRLAVNRFLYLLSRLGINAEGVACLPASVRTLADGAAALGVFVALVVKITSCSSEI